MVSNRTKAWAVLLIIVLGVVTLGLGQTKRATKRTRPKKTTTNSKALPAPTPAAAPTPAEPDPVKKNERHDVPVEMVQPVKAAVNAEAPHYTYEFTQPASTNTRILIEHDGAGRGTITFERRTYADPVIDPVQLSPAAWTKIKGLWESLHFLDSETVYQSERQYPHMGNMRLKLQQGARVRTADFNWTTDHDAAELVAEYRKVGEQAMLVFDIIFARDSEPLSAPDLMRRTEDMLKKNQLSDPGQMVPMLQDLSVDERIPLIARNHAARILKQIKK
ncbi:MAG: hypothetical protein ABIP75_09020 [Pyrinomonadaceae bacterium]